LFCRSCSVIQALVQRPAAIFGSALFFLVAPFTLAGLVPWWISHWEFRPPLLGTDLSRILGICLIVVGLPGIVDSFGRFAMQGLGTPAPIAPTQKLVVTGLYRYVRNPMYVAVLSIIVGQALLFGDLRLLGYGAAFWFACHVFVIAYEEPTLARTFGAEYETYRTNVPRWLPRLTPRGTACR